MRVFSYYSTVPQVNQGDELRLIILWRERWAAIGFEPVVLSEWHARQHPYFEEFTKAIMSLPTSNSKEYEVACFHRWLALSVVGGDNALLMSDYDVMPYGFLPQSLYAMMTYPAEMRFINVMQPVIPCLVATSKPAVDEVCRLFATGKYGLRDFNGKPHVSDMYALEDMVTAKVPLIRTHNYVLGYMDEGWEKAPFVHYCNAAMQPRGKTPRWSHIPMLRQEVI